MGLRAIGTLRLKFSWSQKPKFRSYLNILLSGVIHRNDLISAAWGQILAGVGYVFHFPWLFRNNVNGDHDYVLIYLMPSYYLIYVDYFLPWKPDIRSLYASMRRIDRVIKHDLFCCLISFVILGHYNLPCLIEVAAIGPPALKLAVDFGCVRSWDLIVRLTSRRNPGMVWSVRWTTLLRALE